MRAEELFVPRQVWALSDKHGGRLAKAEFFLAMRLLSLAQAGVQLAADSAWSGPALPPPHIHGLAHSSPPTQPGVGPPEQYGNSASDRSHGDRGRGRGADNVLDDGGQDDDEFGDFTVSPGPTDGNGSSAGSLPSPRQQDQNQAPLAAEDPLKKFMEFSLAGVGAKARDPARSLDALVRQ